MDTELLKLFLPILGGGLAGSLLTFFANRRRETCVASLDVWFFPFFNDESSHPGDIQCYCRFRILTCHNPVDWIEIWPSAGSGRIEYWPSRRGLECECILTADLRKLKLSNLRVGDCIEMLFLLPEKEILQGGPVTPGIIDYKCPRKIYIRSNSVSIRGI